MKIGASIFFQGESDLQRFPLIHHRNLQLSFLRREYLELFIAKNYIKNLQQEKIKVISVHGPNLQIHKDMELVKDTLEKCKSLVSPEIAKVPITLHPQKTPIPTFKQLYELATWAIGKNINISWEMFPSTRGRWAQNLFELNDLAMEFGYSITYDTSHVEDEYWMHPLTWKYVKNNVSILHFSVKPQFPICLGLKEPINNVRANMSYIREHCYINYDKPAYDNWGFLKTVKNSGWNGIIILEYMPHYDDKLDDDVQQITDFFNDKE